MASAFLWGLASASSLVVGGLIASWVSLGKRTLGVVMAFGAGVLISAVAYEMVFEAVRLAKATGYPTVGFFVGAFTFFFADMLIGRMGGEERKAVNATHSSSLVVPLVLAIILDGVP
jgi:ZIP family zinc transporter